MRRLSLSLAFALLAGTAMAQTTSTPASPSSGSATGSSNPAVNTGPNDPARANAPTNTSLVRASALESGSNSFTEGQAKSRFEAAGMSDVKDLKKDDQGIWRARAMREGKAVTAGLDYKGNISAE